MFLMLYLELLQFGHEPIDHGVDVLLQLRKMGSEFQRLRYPLHQPIHLSHLMVVVYGLAATSLLFADESELITAWLEAGNESFSGRGVAGTPIVVLGDHEIYY